MSEFNKIPRLVLLPAVDVAGGKAVRLTQGEAGTETNYGDPVDAAADWARQGAEWIHLVDLDAAFGRGNNTGVIKKVIRQVKGVYKAKYPMLRAGEALILVGAMFLAIFAMIYVMLSATNPEAFTEKLDPFNAYYFALTVLATVGFGDITPSTTAARSVAMVQMAVDIAFIAVLIRIMGGAAKRTIEQRQAKERAESGATA